MAERPREDPGSPGTAMREAVAAEQAARRRIAEAEARAKTDLDAARASARELINAVPARIARLRARGASAVEKALAAIREQEAADARALQQQDMPAARIEETVAALARRLTGGEDA